MGVGNGTPEMEVYSLRYGLRRKQSLETETKNLARSLLRDENLPSSLIQFRWSYERENGSVSYVSIIVV